MEFSIKNLVPKQVSTEPNMCDTLNPFKFKEKKSVRFSDDVVVKSVEMNRTDNINPNKVSYDPDDLPLSSCKQGRYIENTSERMILVGNNSFNKSSKVNDHTAKREVRFTPRNVIEESQLRNYKDFPNPVSHIATCLLTGKPQIRKYITEEELFDTIIFMMEIYEHLEEDYTTRTLDYKAGVSISNRPGKRQRNIIKNKITELTNSVCA